MCVCMFKKKLGSAILLKISNLVFYTESTSTLLKGSLVNAYNTKQKEGKQKIAADLTFTVQLDDKLKC